jgi:hypothetical protein
MHAHTFELDVSFGLLPDEIPKATFFTVTSHLGLNQSSECEFDPRVFCSCFVNYYYVILMCQCAHFVCVPDDFCLVAAAF